jgi:aconitate hydratase 2 / 2-methylisocitrate dehydratase
VIIGGVIAPIFFNTAQDSGALPLKADVAAMKTGDVIVIDSRRGRSPTRGARFSPSSTLAPNTLADEFRAGGRIPLIIGRAVTDKGARPSAWAAEHALHPAGQPVPKGQGYTLAQKMVGKACGVKGSSPVPPVSRR